MSFTLLIAEDDPDQAKLLARLAAEAGFDVSSVADGDQALAELAATPPDALLTDLRLPGADGLALIAALREADAAAPVILATGYATAHNAVEAFHLGVMDVLFKPLELDALRLTLNACGKPWRSAAASTNSRRNSPRVARRRSSTARRRR